MDRKLGIVTINFNTEGLLDRLIQTIISQTYKNWVMVIVNNSVSDLSLNKVINKYDRGKIRLLSLNKNVGYSKGNNAGFDYLYKNNLIIEDDHVLFTNADIVIEDIDFFGQALKKFDQAGCGFWGPKIINTDGSLMLPHIKESNYFKCLLHLGNNGAIDRVLNVGRKIKKMNYQFEVFLLNGAFFVCNAGDFIKAGRLDENTFIYYEEELLYRKVADKKIKVLYDPTVYVLHEHSGSVKKSFNILQKKRFVYDSELYFLRKILKVNKFLEYVFMVERNLEFLLYKLSMFLLKK